MPPSLPPVPSRLTLPSAEISTSIVIESILYCAIASGRELKTSFILSSSALKLLLRSSRSTFVAKRGMAVLERFGGLGLARQIVGHAIEHCRRKGYASLYAHSQKRLVGFWAQFGFAPLGKNTRLVFSDHEYIELGAEFPRHASPITRANDPYLILRPEGCWDSLGILDRSATRPATNPH